MNDNLKRVLFSRIFIRITACTMLAAGYLPRVYATSGYTIDIVQQQKQMTGKITDVKGNPIIGANVLEKGTTNGAISDIDGNFKLSLKPGATLLITYIGYKPEEVKVGNGPLKVIMKEDNETLSEVVVVGFGTQKKVNLTGSVSVVSGEDMALRPVSNATQALQGMVPGLQITSASGSLDSSPSINVRGTTTIGQGTSGSPLVLIDGMEGDLNTLNPQDIASISVLKDAAASSIYGSRAPFGVILVTTKKGTKNGKVQINYNNSFRWATPIRMKHLMSSVDFASMTNDAFSNGGQGIYFDNQRMEKIASFANAKPYGPGQRITEDGKIIYSLDADPNNPSVWGNSFIMGNDNTDWYDVIYKKWTFSQEHNFSASGGSEKFNYYTSFGYLGQDGLVKVGDDKLKRYNISAKINSELTNWLRFSYSYRFMRKDFKRPNALGEYLYLYLGGQWPTVPLYDRNGNYAADQVLSMATGGDYKSQTDETYHQASLIFEPIKNWLTHVEFNYRIQSTNNHYEDQQTYFYNVNNEAYLANSYSGVDEDYYKENYYNFQVYSEYNHSFAEKHNFHIMGGFQAEDLQQTQFGLYRNGIMIPEKPQVDMTSGLGPDGLPVTPGTWGSRNEWSIAGFFGRLNYDYNGKYLLEVNVRGDGSSRFRLGNQWKVFPSISIGWNIAREKLFEPLNETINQLKLRGSYGSLGNQNTDNWYQTFQTVPVQAGAGTWLQNGIKPNIAGAPGLVSETMTWEKIESYNIGLDWGLFNNRLTGSFDWYVRNTKDMIGNAPELPALLGTSVPVTNNTDLKTNGWELSIGWQDRLPNGVNYGAKFNISDSRAKITRYPNNPTNSIWTYVKGRYINEIWGYETVGIAKSNEEMKEHLSKVDQSSLGDNWAAGDIMYADLNHDGKISGGSETINDHGDYKLIGNSTPRYLFGLDLNASWKGFDFRLFFQGVMKRDYWTNIDYLFGTYGYGQWYTKCISEVQDYFRDSNTWSVQNGYQAENLNAYLPRALYSNKNLQTQTRYLQNAAYIRLKNLQFGYTLPRTLTAKWGLENMRIFFSGENLWTGTKLAKQFDPETLGTYQGNGYPLTTTLSGGLNITF